MAPPGQRPCPAAPRFPGSSKQPPQPGPFRPLNPGPLTSYPQSIFLLAYSLGPLGLPFFLPCCMCAAAPAGPSARAPAGSPACCRASPRSDVDTPRPAASVCVCAATASATSLDLSIVFCPSSSRCQSCCAPNMHQFYKGIATWCGVQHTRKLSALVAAPTLCNKHS